MGWSGSGLDASMSWTNANSLSVYSSLRALPRSVIRSKSLLRLSFIMLCGPAKGISRFCTTKLSYSKPGVDQQHHFRPYLQITLASTQR